MLGQVVPATLGVLGPRNGAGRKRFGRYCCRCRHAAPCVKQRVADMRGSHGRARRQPLPHLTQQPLLRSIPRVADKTALYIKNYMRVRTLKCGSSDVPPVTNMFCDKQQRHEFIRHGVLVFFPPSHTPRPWRAGHAADTCEAQTKPTHRHPFDRRPAACLAERQSGRTLVIRFTHTRKKEDATSRAYLGGANAFNVNTKLVVERYFLSLLSRR